MNLIRKGHGPAHRGIIGIESAIVLIAFVIVAAALAFVVLNMGFSTTQKAKTAIIAAVEEAGSSMEVAGKITAGGDVVNEQLNSTQTPVKIVSGGASSNLDGNFTSVKFITDIREYDNIYEGTLHYGTYDNASAAWASAIASGFFGLSAGDSPFGAPGSGPSQTTAFFYWTVNQNNNTILDIGEHVVLTVGYTTSDKPNSLTQLALEVSTPTGAPLTIERTVPNISTQIIDMG